MVGINAERARALAMRVLDRFPRRRESIEMLAVVRSPVTTLWTVGIMDWDGSIDVLEGNIVVEYDPLDAKGGKLKDRWVLDRTTNNGWRILPPAQHC